MTQKGSIFIALLLFVVPVALAQDEGNPFEEYFFPPELVMQHQRAIKLTDAQKTTIREATLEAQTLFTDIQWKLLDEVEDLKVLTQKERVDEDAVLEGLDRILALEQQLKRGQTRLVVRIKNTLTSEQQQQLQDLRFWGTSER